LPSLQNSLSALDYTVIAIYLVSTIWLGIHIGRKIKTGADFFLAGRSLPWWAVGMSLVATDIGGTDIIGVGGAAYKHGLAVANFEWIGCVPAMIVGALVFIPFLYRTGVYTIPEYLERRYNASVRSVLAACWLAFMACNLGIMLLASAKLMSAMFGWNPLLCIIGTAVLVGFYTSFGGLAAVVYTDVIQCVVMIVGCLVVLIIGLGKVGGVSGLQERLQQASAREAEAAETPGLKLQATGQGQPDIEAATVRNDRTQLIMPVDTDTPFPWPGIYFGLAMILSPAYWIGNQAIIQRSLGARSEFEAKASYVWGALLKNVIPIIIAVPGLIAVALFPDLTDGDQAVPQLVGAILPTGLRGLFVAAFMAALMSSVDSYLNSASTIVSYDFYKRYFNKDVTSEQLLVVGRVTTLVLVAWAILFAIMLMQLSKDSGLYAIFQTLMAFFQGPAFAVLLMGMLWRRATGTAAIIALLAGIATSVTLYSLNQAIVYEALGWKPLFRVQDPYLYFSIWAFLVSLVLLVVLSYCTRPERAEKSDLVIWGVKLR
jgi:SSS family solute:Na+ symporter